MSNLISEFKKILMLLFFGLLISSCSTRLTAQESAGIQPTSTQQKTATPTVMTRNDQLSTLTATPYASDLTSLDGPLMLLQTGVDSFHFLDLATYRLIPYDLPGIITNLRLASNLSPDGKHLLIFTSEQSFEIVNILSRESSFFYDFSRDALNFDMGQVIERALQVFPAYTSEFLQDLIEQTIAQSQHDIEWFQDDQVLLVIIEDNGINSNLAMLDLNTGETKLLEQIPRLVEKYWLGPGDDKILLKKGFSSAPNDWQDDQYYLLDLVNENSIEISMPSNIQNPSVYWFSDDQIGVIHQTGIAGSMDFSLVSIPDMDTRQVVTGSFSSLYTYGSDILTLYQDRESQRTNLTLRSLIGDILSTQDLAGICSVKRKITGSSLLLNCDSNSYLVEGQDLSISEFGEPIFLFTRSPDRQYYVLITKEKGINLVTGDLQYQTPIQLQGDPLEILWLPDSSGFLYRTSRELFHYDIITNVNKYILSSDLFGDYRNLNAVWISLD